MGKVEHGAMVGKSGQQWATVGSGGSKVWERRVQFFWPMIWDTLGYCGRWRWLRCERAVVARPSPHSSGGGTGVLFLGVLSGYCIVVCIAGFIGGLYWDGKGWRWRRARER